MDNPLARKTVEVVSLQAGQLKRYGDSIYEAELFFDYPDSDKMQYDPPESTVKELIKLLVRGFNEDDWWRRLDVLEKRGKGHWYVKIVWPWDG